MILTRCDYCGRHGDTWTCDGCGAPTRPLKMQQAAPQFAVEVSSIVPSSAKYSIPIVDPLTGQAVTP